MTEKQFELFLEAISIHATAILEKLEEIKNGLIDVEGEIKDGFGNQKPKITEPEMFCVNCDTVATKPITARYGKYCGACGNILNTSMRIV